jgi:predicted MFS family arabinose efflux permease
MAAAEALRFISLLSVVLLLVFGGLTLPLLAVLGLVGTCGTVAYGVTAPALVPALVQPNALPAANGRIELARTTAFAAGPALGGSLTGWIGGAPAFGVAAGLSACAVILLVGVVEPQRLKTPSLHPLRALREGIAFVLRHRLLRPIFVTQFIFNTALFIIMAVYVPYAIRALQLSAAGVGITLAAFGVGMVAGALLAAQIMHLLRLGTAIAIGPLSGLAAALVMVLTLWMPFPALAALSFFLMGAGPIVWVVSTTTLRQTVTPEELLGRVSAINSVAYGARPLGAETCFVVAAFGFLLQAAVIMLSPVIRLHRQIEMI